jgi:hypothetical protein
MDKDALAKLFEVCAKHYLGEWERQQIVIPEPYIPHFLVGGAHWNGVLVLAEAQNLRNTEHDYPAKLKKAHADGNRETLWNRLNLSWSQFPKHFATVADGVHRDVAIRPWQNGVIPSVVAAIAQFGGDNAADVFEAGDPVAAIRRVMVSNAVPWSRVDARGQNLNPGGEEMKRAVRFWAELLPALTASAGTVRLLLAFGRTAERVMQQAAPDTPMLALFGPFDLNRARLRNDEKQLALALRARIRALLGSIGDQVRIRAPGDRELAYLSAASALLRWHR